MGRGEAERRGAVVGVRRVLWSGWGILLVLALLVEGQRPILAETTEVTPLPPVTGLDGRAGMCYSFYDPPERPYLSLALNAGSRWDRFDFVWPNIEPSNDQWNFSGYDDLVDDLHAAGMNIVGILLWTPGWAASSDCQVGGQAVSRAAWLSPSRYPPMSPLGLSILSADPATCPPDGLFLPWNDPDNHWGNFVYTVVSRYKDRVKHWEMWNEPDYCDPGYLCAWSGTSVDYAQLLKVGYQATKAACPDCTVLFGGLHFWANPSFYRWVLNILNDDPTAPENNYFFDVMSLHTYSRSWDAYWLVETVREGMLDFVPEHPIWLTEVGVPVWDDETVDPDPTPYIWTATQDEAAAYVIQTYANAWAAHVERYFYFRTHDDWCDKNGDGDCYDWGIDQGMWEFYGLVRDDRSLRPAYVAYQVAATYMVSPTMVTNWTYSSGVRRVTLWGTPRGKVSVLWNRVPTSTVFYYPATLPTATLVDRLGNRQTITAANGRYTLYLPGATDNLGLAPDDYIIGGEPYLVIEADTVPPTATVRSISYLSPVTLTVSWEGEDDAAGIWLYDVQVQEGESGAWEGWLRMTDAESADYVRQQSDAGYCFRVRAWDKAGNRGAWSAPMCAPPERDVLLDLRSVFGDQNGNGVQDGEEVTLTARLALVSGGSVLTSTVSASWRFSITLMAGDYILAVVPMGWPSPPPGWLPRYLAVPVEPGGGLQAVGPLDVGLPPHNESIFLPSVSRDG